MRYVRPFEVKNSKGCRVIILQIWFTFLNAANVCSIFELN